MNIARVKELTGLTTLVELGRGYFKTFINNGDQEVEIQIDSDYMYYEDEEIADMINEQISIMEAE